MPPIGPSVCVRRVSMYGPYRVRVPKHCLHLVYMYVGLGGHFLRPRTHRSQIRH